MAEEKPKVLFVEDDPFMTGLISQELEKSGFSVSFVANGEEASERFKQEKPDALLLDLLLPGKSGMEVLREIRALPGGANIPTVVLTNMESSESLQDAQELGVKSYLIKANVQLPEVVAKLKEAMGK